MLTVRVLEELRQRLLQQLILVLHETHLVRLAKLAQIHSEDLINRPIAVEQAVVPGAHVFGKLSR